MRLRLKGWRERRLLTQAELAERAGLTVGTVNRIERGANPPRLSTVRRLAEALGVDPDELVDWEGSDDPEGRRGGSPEEGTGTWPSANERRKEFQCGAA